MAFDIDKFNVGKNYCIEASAGTGKTFTIRKIVAELVKRGIPVGKILLVTYTEKAAGELRDRIQAELKELAATQLSPEELKNVKKSLAELDNATIGTIHSFCQKTLHDFAYEADVPFALSMAGDEVAENVVRKKIRDEWAEEIVSQELNAKNLQKWMTNSVKSIGEGMENDAFLRNLEALQKFAGESYLALPQKNGKTPTTYRVGDLISAIREKSFSKTRNGSVLSGSVENPELQELLEYFIDKGYAEKCKEDLPSKEYLLSHLPETREAFQRQKRENKLQSFDDMIQQVRDAVISRDGSETPLCQKLRETYLYAIVDEFQDTNQAQWDIFKTVFLDSPKNHIVVVGDPKQSIYSFQGADLNVYLSAIDEISKKGSKERLGTNFRSTNEMVEACNRIFCGDYFKGSTGVSVEFENSAASGDILSPTWNGKEIRPVFLCQTDGESDDAESFARYAVKKIVGFVQKDDSGKTALQCFDKDSKKFRNLKLSDIAVLARTRSEMEEMESAMRDVGIPFVRYKDANLFKGHEAHQWIALLKALDAPDFSGKNRSLLSEALVSDFFRLDFGDVENEKFDFPNNPEIQKFSRWRAILEKGRYAELLESIYAETQIDEYLCDSSKLQSFAKIKQIGNYIFDYLYENGVTVEEVVKHLEGLSLDAEEADDEDGNLVSKGSDFDTVQVMTIHASKGLQFPVVISAAGFKGWNNKAEPPYIYRDGKRKIFGLTKEAKENRQKEELEEWRRLFYVNFTRAESVLVMPYYTKTWEKTKAFEFLKKALGAENAAFRELAEVENLTQEEWNAEELRKKMSGNLENQSEDDDKETNEHILRLNRDIDGKSIFQHSYSSLTGKLDKNECSVDGENRDAEDGAESIPSPSKDPIDANPKRISLAASAEVSENVYGKVKNFPKGSLLGNAMHQVFEKMDFVEIGGLASSKEAVQNAEFQKLIGEQFLSQAFNAAEHPDWISQMAHFAWNTMNANFPEIHGNRATGNAFRLKELPAENRLPEMEFHLNADVGAALRNYCKGFMDLLFKRGDFYSILDWKSDVLESYSAVDAMEKVDSDYAVQRVLYSYCLVRWLQSFMPEKSEEQIFREHFGGVYYVFVRGCRAGESSGLYAQTWESFADLEKAFEQLKKNLMNQGKGEKNV